MTDEQPESERLAILRGTLDVLILKSLSWGPAHGYAVASAIQRHSDGVLLIEEGALYPALHRLEKKGWLAAEWGVSENQRRAKFYSLTIDGKNALARSRRDWTRYSDAVSRVLEARTL